MGGERLQSVSKNADWDVWNFSNLMTQGCGVVSSPGCVFDGVQKMDGFPQNQFFRGNWWKREKRNQK